MAILNFICMMLLAFLVHELGHYIALTSVGIKANEVAVGFGPKLLRFKFNGTYFSLRIVPLGGYTSWDKKKVRVLSLLKQIFIVISGIISNYMAFIISFSIIFKANILLVVTKINSFFISDFIELFSNIKLNDIYTPKGNLEGNLNVMRNVGSTDSLIMIFAIVNMALFIFNIMPLPGLDGGKIIESIARKALVKMRFKESIIDRIMKPLYAASFIFLISPFIINEILAILEKGYH